MDTCTSKLSAIGCIGSSSEGPKVTMGKPTAISAGSNGTHGFMPMTTRKNLAINERTCVNRPSVPRLAAEKLKPLLVLDVQREAQIYRCGRYSR